MPVVSEFTDYCNVYTKENWSDAWVLRDDLICLELSLTLGDAIDSAAFLWRSGQIMYQETSQFVSVDEMLLRGWYVRIERTLDPVLDWVGYVTAEAQEPAGAKDWGAGLTLTTNDQIFQAVGMEWFLDRRQIIDAVHYGTPDPYRTQRPLGFNQGMGNQRDSAQQIKGNKDSRLAYTAFPVFVSNVGFEEEWTATDAIDYLLQWHQPSDVGYTPAAPEIFRAVGAATFLDWFKPIVSLDGRTVLSVIRDIINARRGLVWWLRYLHDPDPNSAVMFLEVNSVTSADVALPGSVTLPQNSSIQTLDTDVDRTVSKARISTDNTNRYDRIRVRGARRVSVFTISPADGNLVEGWNTSVIEPDYKSAGSLTTAEAADRYRRAEEFAHVYTRFLIASNWDGQSRDGSGAGTFEFACPVMPQGSTSILDTEQFTLHGLRLLRTLPMKQGYDYTSAIAPVANDAANDPAELMQPFGIIKHDNKWHFLERASGNLDETTTSKRLKTSYNLRVLDATPGVEIIPSASMPHAIAKNHFDSGSPAPSKYKTEVDYDDLRVTVAAEWDCYCEGYYPDTNPTASPLQELTIYIGERARLDYLAKGTVFDVKNSTIRTVATGGPLRDDRELCRQIAQVAYAWYSLPRRSFVVDYHVIAQPVGLGDYIQTFGAVVPGSGSTLRSADSIVTQIVHNFAVGKSSISGGFPELDFAGIV